MEDYLDTTAQEAASETGKQLSLFASSPNTDTHMTTMLLMRLYASN